MIVILGDSHTIALKDAYDALTPSKQTQVAGPHGKISIGQLNYAGSFLNKFHDVHDTQITFSDSKTANFLGRILDGSPTGISKNCTRRYVFSLGFHPSGSMLPKRWTNHSREKGTVSRHYVSERAFRTFVREYNNHILTFYKDLLDLNIMFSVMSCCPLPVGYYTEEVQQVFSKSEMGNWHLNFRQAFRDELMNLGINFHEPPNNIYTKDALYMRQEFSSDRKPGEYHANPKYGKIMINKIISDLTDAI